MPEYIHIEQQTDEWFSARIGSIGGSSISSVLAKGQGKTRQDLMYKLAGEILTGQKTESYRNAYMDRGNQFEPEAREYYEFINDVEVEQVGLIKSDIPGIHSSPDGLVGFNGGLEIKTQLPHVFIATKDTEKISRDYILQCQHFLWVSGREWIDFMAYCPEMPNPSWIKRIYRDEKQIEEIKSECLKFIDELNTLVERMR
jgi:putative phage-type endonuclease